MHSTILVASLLALLFGPLAYAWLNRQRKLSAVLDGFVFLSIGGIVLLEALPEAVHHGGLLAWIALAVGFFGPSIAERLAAYPTGYHGGRVRAHRVRRRDGLDEPGRAARPPESHPGGQRDGQPRVAQAPSAGANKSRRTRAGVRSFAYGM